MSYTFQKLLGKRAQSMIFAPFLLFFIQFTAALQEVEVYRLIAYEDNNQVFGSKITSFNLVATHFTGDLLRKVAVIQFAEISEENFSQLFQKRPSGLVVILPVEQLESGVEQQIWDLVAKFLVSRKLEIPVYFSKGSSTMSEVYSKLEAAAKKRALADESKLHFILKSEDATLLNSVQLEDFSFLLDESIPPAKFSASTNPIILLVASCDSYSLVPDLSLGFNEYASGASGLVYIARHLSRLLSQNPKTKYNVLFYLSSASNFKYEGLQLWLNRAENAKIVNKIDYALLLNSIASDESLSLRILNSDSFKGDSANQFLNKLKQTSTTYGKDVKVLNTSDVMLSQRFPVLKFTDDKTNDEAKKIYGSSVHLSSNLSVLKSNLLFLTELLTNTIYDINTDFQILDEKSIDNEYLMAVVEYFRAKSTFATQITRESEFSKELFTILQTVNKTVTRSPFTYTQPKYYSSKPALLQITKSSSAFLDFYIFSGVVAWLTVLYFILNKFVSRDQDHYKSS